MVGLKEIWTDLKSQGKAKDIPSPSARLPGLFPRRLRKARSKAMMQCTLANVDPVRSSTSSSAQNNPTEPSTIERRVCWARPAPRRPGMLAEWSFAALEDARRPQPRDEIASTTLGDFTVRRHNACAGSSLHVQDGALRLPRRCNTTTYWNQLGARGGAWDDMSGGEAEDTVDAYEDKHAVIDHEIFTQDTYVTTPELEVLGNTVPSASYRQPRDRKDFYRDRMKLWSEHSPDAEFGILDISLDELASQQKLYDELPGKQARDAECWWEDGNTQTAQEAEMYDWVSLGQMQKQRKAQKRPRRKPVPNRVRDEHILADGTATPTPQQDESWQDVIEQVRDLEDAAKQIDQQIIQLTTDLILMSESGKLQADSQVEDASLAKIAGLEEIGQEIRNRVWQLKGKTVKREDESLPRAHEQEDTDHLHALQLHEEQRREAEESRKQAQVGRLRDCAACAETRPPIHFPLKPPTPKCEHPPNICSSCLQSWMASELETKGCSAFKCPECPQTMTFTDVQAAASEETFAAFDKLATRQALGGLEEFAWCLKPGCGNGQLNEENNPFMICSACRYEQCLKHQMAWHYGESCDLYDYRVSGRQAEDEARARREEVTKLQHEAVRAKQLAERDVRKEARRKATEESSTAAMIGTVSQLCPGGCGARIQRSAGCDHMTCRTCRHEFCFLCLAPHDEIARVGNSAHRRSCKNHSSNVR